MYKIPVVLLLLIPGVVRAQESAESVSSSASTTAPLASSPTDDSRWFGRIGIVGAIYHSGATISTDSAVIPGAAAVVGNNISVTLDIGCEITKSVSAQLMLGIPPKPSVTGEGTVAALGELGSVRYGPVILSGNYRARRLGAFQPYAGAGVAYAIILTDHDASVSDLHVQNNFGFVFQGGLEYTLERKWSLFADFKEVWLAVDAHGLIAGTIPVTAHIKLDPSLVSAGLKYRF